MNIRRAALVPLLIVALFGLALAGCGGDDGDADAVIAALVAEGATQDEARCMVDELGADKVERFFLAEDDDDLSEEDIEDLLEALEACGIDE